MLHDTMRVHLVIAARAAHLDQQLLAACGIHRLVHLIHHGVAMLGVNCAGPAYVGMQLSRQTNTRLDSQYTMGCSCGYSRACRRYGFAFAFVHHAVRQQHTLLVMKELQGEGR